MINRINKRRHRGQKANPRAPILPEVDLNSALVTDYLLLDLRKQFLSKKK